jgi:hypothetical protein
MHPCVRFASILLAITLDHDGRQGCLRSPRKDACAPLKLLTG